MASNPKATKDPEPPPKCPKSGMSRVWQAFVYGVPMDSGEDEWEGDEPTREELINEYGSDYDSDYEWKKWIKQAQIDARRIENAKKHKHDHESKDENADCGGKKKKAKK